MSYWHITIASRGRLVLARDVTAVRALVRAIARSGGERLVLFALVDDHLHLLVEEEGEGRPALLARDFARVVRRLAPGVELAPTDVRRVESRAHLLRLVGYLLGQPRKHGLAVHPAVWEGGCFVDLIGARHLPGFDRGALGRALPRLRLRELLDHVELPQEPIAPATPADALQLGVARLLEAAAGAFALPPGLFGADRATVEARAVAIQAALAAGFRPAGILPLVSVGERELRRLARREIPAAAHGALARWLGLELAVARSKVAERPAAPPSRP